MAQATSELHPPRGRFITFEGGEGGGKSTQLRRLAASLRAAGLTIVETREPGGSPSAEKIRAFILGGQAKEMGAVAELFLFNAARHDHVKNLIAPALARGDWVLCDRFADSSRIYQAVAGGADEQLTLGLEKLVIGATRPDLTLILDAPVAVGLARARARGAADRFEAEASAVHERIREGFLELARSEPDRCAVIDANRPEDAVATDIRRIVRERFSP